jgi:hypothetical protein
VPGLPIKRIPVPDWVPAHARGVVQRSDGFAEEAYQAVQGHREAILALLHATVESYLRDMAFDDGFPRRDRLTGEYYIGSECYSVAINPCRDPVSGVVFVPCYRVNFRVRCLQWPRPPHVPRFDDYLGLDVDIRCDPDEWRLCVFGCDSSVI